jgi:hypothetical protein
MNDFFYERTQKNKTNVHGLATLLDGSKRVALNTASCFSRSSWFCGEPSTKRTTQRPSFASLQASGVALVISKSSGAAAEAEPPAYVV